MSYIKNFKKFLKHEEKETEKIGANPSLEEQTDVAPADAAATDTATQPAAPAPASVESDPAVIAARQASANAIANRDKVLSAKQKELSDLKVAQDSLVNDANKKLNDALAAAAKKDTSATA